MNETEKLTINLGVVELAQIDVLVEQGIYANRSDFIRTAIRKNLETQSEKIKLQLTPVSRKKEWITMIGIFVITKKSLEILVKDGDKLNLNVIGMLVINKDVSKELFMAAVENIIYRGKLNATSEIKEVIKSMQ